MTRSFVLPAHAPEAMHADEEAFYDWFKQSGGTIDARVSLTQWPGMGRGAVALDDIPAETVLFSIPHSLLLTTSTSKLPSLLPEDEWTNLEGWTPLILVMMYESFSPDAKWKPYFDLLPATFDSLMFWSDDEINELQGSMVRDKIGREEADEQFENIVKPLVAKYPIVFGDKEQYTLDLFHRCGSLILSRSFHVSHKPTNEKDSDSEDEDEEEEREDVADVAMVPFADLLNARAGCNNAKIFYEPQTLNMMSTKPIKAGEQIWNTYGDDVPNSDLLRRYGHVDPDSPSDLVEIGLELVSQIAGGQGQLNEDAIAERGEWLLEMGVDDAFTLDKSHEVPDELISVVRLFLASNDDWQKCKRKENPPKPKVDRQVATVIKQILETRIRQYSTTIEEDERLLQQDLPLRKRMAVDVRLEEKRILDGVLGAVTRDWLSKRKADDDDTKAAKKARS